MKKVLLISLALITSFGLGFAFNNLITEKAAGNERKVTGIGGIFFKCKDPGKVKEWYQTNLGLKTNPYGAVFEWKQAMDSTKKGFTQWSPFSEKTKYFDKDYMINYRVADLTALVKELRKNGVIVADSVQTDELGKFVHIIDIEGNKVELWEPNDVACENYGKQNGMPTTK